MPAGANERDKVKVETCCIWAIPCVIAAMNGIADGIADGGICLCVCVRMGIVVRILRHAGSELRALPTLKKVIPADGRHIAAAGALGALRRAVVPNSETKTKAGKMFMQATENQPGDAKPRTTGK